MSVTVSIRNESTRKRIYRNDVLTRLAARICRGEAIRQNTEVSVLLCDDPQIQALNRRFRNVNAPTDVLSFEQDAIDRAGATLLGDIVISLETVERECSGDRPLMREELAMLFCHGLLHLLGYDHANDRQRHAMTAKQAHYLGLPVDDAWQFGPRVTSRRRRVLEGAPSGG